MGHRHMIAAIEAARKKKMNFVANWMTQFFLTTFHDVNLSAD